VASVDRSLYVSEPTNRCSASKEEADDGASVESIRVQLQVMDAATATASSCDSVDDDDDDAVV
jgi:hypothetical protein